MGNARNLITHLSEQEDAGRVLRTLLKFYRNNGLTDDVTTVQCDRMDEKQIAEELVS